MLHKFISVGLSGKQVSINSFDKPVPGWPFWASITGNVFGINKDSFHGNQYVSSSLGICHVGVDLVKSN